jgi:hypothetical protein
MANLAVNCGAEYGNLGSLCGSKNSFRMVTMILLTTPDVIFDDAAKFADITEYEALIKAGKMHVLKGVQEIDDNSVETKYYDAPSGMSTKTKDAVYSFLYKFLLTMEQHKELQKFDGQSMRYFKVDSSGNVLGYADKQGVIRGFSIDTFSTENMVMPTNTDAPAFSPIRITETDRNEWNVFGVYVKPDWLVSSLKSLAPVQVEIIGTPTGAEIKARVFYDAGINGDGTVNAIGIHGLEVVDFDLVDASGTKQIVDTAVEGADGVYTLGGTTAFVSGLLSLIDPPSMTEGLFIIAANDAVVTI